jgi:Tfp pilus assembly protein PilF
MRALVAVATLACLGTPAAAQAQSRPATLIAAARSQLQARRLDSAAILLRQAVDTGSGGTLGEHVEAWVLLGVVHFYSGDDSAAANDFHQALSLDRRFEPTGLVLSDSELAHLFAAERARLPSAPTPSLAGSDEPTARRTGTAAEAMGDLSVHECVPRCAAGEVMPRLRNIPRLTTLDQIPMGALRMRGLVLVRLIVSAAGIPEPESIHVISGSLVAVDAEVVRAVQAALFRPALANGHPVRASVEVRFEFETAGSAIQYRVLGP